MKLLLFCEISTACSYSILFFRYSASILSISTPPRCESPAIDLTLKLLPSISSIDTSKVPPPKSKMQYFLRGELVVLISLTIARAAATGSLIMRLHYSPAIFAAYSVDYFWLSLKYAGTVITQFTTSYWASILAAFYIFSKILAWISSG